MSLLDLPNELLSQCCSTAKTKSLRLTCKRFAIVFAQQLFANIRLLPTPLSAKRALSILEHEHLSPLVTGITIKTYWCNEDVDRSLVDSVPRWDIEILENDTSPLTTGDSTSSIPYGHEFDQGRSRDGSEDAKSREVSDIFKRLLSKIGLFKNLRRFKLLHTAMVDEPAFSDAHEDLLQAPESIHFRQKIFRQIVKALNHPEHPASKVHSLSIVNMQDVVDKPLMTSDDFKAVMSRIDTLELSIASWHEIENTGDLSAELESHKMHSFWGARLRSYWLIPIRSQLVRLILASRWAHWGYVPRCNLKGLHFPKLRELHLGKMTFTHDWQLNWIISHGKTLRKLTLNDCPILHAIWIGCPLDDRHNPVLRPGRSLYWENEDAGSLNYWTYDRRWHSYFQKFNKGLPLLREFKLSPRSVCSLSDPPKLGRARYCIFFSAQWCGIEHVQYPDRSGNYDGMMGDTSYMRPRPWYPDCLKKDQHALNYFLKTIKKRNQLRLLSTA